MIFKLKKIFLKFYDPKIEAIPKEHFEALVLEIRDFYHMRKLPSGKELRDLVRKYSDEQSEGVPEFQSSTMDNLFQENMRTCIKWLQEQGF